MRLAHSLLLGSSTVWKGFWDTLRGDGVLSSSLATKFTWSYLDRLFYIEGVLTIFVALVAAFILPDFPSTSRRWLSPIEVRLAEKRMEEDAGVGDEGQTEIKSGRVLLDALTDWKVMYMALKCFILHISRVHLTYPLREVSPVSSSPSHSTRSSPPSPPRLAITEP